MSEKIVHAEDVVISIVYKDKVYQTTRSFTDAFLKNQMSNKALQGALVHNVAGGTQQLMWRILRYEEKPIAFIEKIGEKITND